MCCITGPAGGRISLNGEPMGLNSKLEAMPYLAHFLVPQGAHTELQTIYLVDSHI